MYFIFWNKKYEKVGDVASGKDLVLQNKQTKEDERQKTNIIEYWLYDKQYPESSLCVLNHISIKTLQITKLYRLRKLRLK